MADRQAISQGFPFPTMIDETGMRQAISLNVYVSETISGAVQTSTRAPKTLFTQVIFYEYGQY